MHIDELLTFSQPAWINETTAVYRERIISADWGQGRTAFGGITAGMVFTAINAQVEDSRVLRAFNTNFIGPITLDYPFDIEVVKLREGKNVSHFSGQIIQNGKVCVASQACFGVGRVSKISVENHEVHAMSAPRKAQFIPQIPKVTPKFLRHFDLAIAEGGVPFTGRKTHHYHGFMRFSQAPETLTDGHLITMIDAWPPTLLQMMRWPAPASTVTWNIEFIHPHRPVSGADWFAYQAHTRQAADGYGHTEATIWDKDNEVVAISRQTVAVFD
ncbi:acyl-CoA thioesterase [Salinimonas chungwhensis]|uniref:acyl-CoA thioesterase n=1 Tax=Salinimonas chungwhensis TaxID=265425 RepID=UPI000373BC8D|nr:thioesterase family protein [Salinimonas chungwhensis]